ncbi:MAG: hypothetical protein V7K35_03180 [Nostoc sp.]
MNRQISNKTRWQLKRPPDCDRPTALWASYGRRWQSDRFRV